MVLVLRASWFSLSSCSRAKEMAALSVWLISVGRWHPRDFSQKAATMVEEEEGSSDVGYSCAVTLWLRVAWSQQGYSYSRRKMGQRYARLLQRRTMVIRSKRPLLVMFNLFLAMINIVGSEILLRLRCRQIAAKDRC
ncbi:hypothetical protein B296_00019529 [Ensete ventricosum]|uniref:Uncharacterized protein n=1 Tax=Ensete ventricosum TaxID=4639 RepID=A0A427A4M4_ENSVE|nr:hypothetical protein B296_00019529 [Ensete ventricosum]